MLLFFVFLTNFQKVINQLTIFPMYKYIYFLLNVVYMRSLPSQPFVVCRQCPGYRKEGGSDPFATGSSFLGHPRPAPLLGPSPPVAPGAAGPEPQEEGGKPAGEQPSTSADGPAGTSLCGKVCWEPGLAWLYLREQERMLLIFYLMFRNSRGKRQWEKKKHLLKYSVLILKVVNSDFEVLEKWKDYDFQ